MKILLSVLGVAGLFVATSSIAGEGYIGASAGIMNIEDDSADIRCISCRNDSTPTSPPVHNDLIFRRSSQIPQVFIEFP